MGQAGDPWDPDALARLTGADGALGHCWCGSEFAKGHWVQGTGQLPQEPCQPWLFEQS